MTRRLPFIEASPLDLSAHRLTTSQTPRRVIDAEIRGQFRERRPGRSGLTGLARWPASTGSIQEPRFFLWDVFLGGVRFSRIRRLHGSLLLTRTRLHRD